MTKYICFLFSLLLSASLSAQSWQWGRHGGSVSSPPVGETAPVVTEEARNLCTDPHGNVYFHSQIAEFPYYLGGVYYQVPPFSQINLRTSVLMSYDCRGDLRWYKQFVTEGGTSQITALTSDREGNLYVAGYTGALPVGPKTFHLGTDTTLVNATKFLFLAKYDTSGVLQWLRQPEPDTAMNQAAAIFGLSASPEGDVYAYSLVRNGGLLAGGDSVVLDSGGIYVLRFSSGGQILEATPLDIHDESPNGQSYPRNFERDHQSGRFYLGGWRSLLPGLPPLLMGGQPLNPGLYFAAFDSTGQFLWVRQTASDAAIGVLRKPRIDHEGNIYIAGSVYIRIGGIPDTIAGHVFTTTLNLGNNPMAMCLDPDGQAIWATHGMSVSIARGDGIALYERPDGSMEVGASASFTGMVVWGGDTVPTIPGQAYDPLLVRLDAKTGANLSLTRLTGLPGNSQFSSSLTVDRRGNYYLGGRMGGPGNQLYVGPDTLQSYGGVNDFFIAKYGSDDCALCLDPVAQWVATHDSTSLSLGLSYTGSAYDSLVWHFGDGTLSNDPSPSHLYAEPGSYQICVEVFNACGADQVCSTLTICTKPEAAFSYGRDQLELSLGYSSSAPYDSLVWHLGDGSTATGPSVSHLYAEPGSYEICLYAYTLCGVDSACEQIELLGTGLSALWPGLRLYPNPAQDYLHLDPLPPGLRYTLIDPLGRVQAQGPLPSGKASIPLQGLPPGTYFLRLEGPKRIATEKVVVGE
jgi:outer membrane protein assembly factor BamB